MKLTTFILLSACLTASAKTGAQTIKLDVKDAPLERVFAQIKKQSGYSFVYYKEDLAKGEKITLHLSSASIDEVLQQVLKDQPFTYKIVDRTIVIARKEAGLSPAGGGGSDHRELTGVDNGNPPPIDIHGRILNEKGEPVIASVQVKGTNKGTTTNDNGEFELKGISDDAVLVISGVSIETFEVKVNGRSELALNAKIKTNVGEAVKIEANTGYQRVKPNEVTGSIVVIDNKTLNQQTGLNILDRLNNVTSGLYFNIGKSNPNPQSKTNISIRGLSTINGPLDPLIVVDNFIYEGDINNINPDNVENITILKDAAAASIWGARAGNGVIVITTKRGSFNQKLKIGFNSNVTITDKPNLYYPSQISSADAIDVEQWLFNQGFFDGQINNTSQWPALPPAVEIFLKTRNGFLSSTDSANQVNTLKTIDTRDQLNKYFYQKAVTQQYALNFNGGSNNIAWLISGAYDKSIGTLKNEYNRANFRFVNTYKVTKNLQVEAGASYTATKTKSGVAPITSVGDWQIPYLQFVDNNGNALPVYQKIRAEYIDTVGGGKLLDWKYYPLEDYKHDSQTDKLQELVANVGVSYHVLNGIDIRVNYQYQRQITNSERLADKESFYARNLINNFSQIDYSNGSVANIIPVGGYLNQIVKDLSSQNFRGQVNYHKRWNDHAISAMVGTETREIINSASSLSYYGYNKDPLSYGKVDFINLYPTLIPGYSQQIPNNPFPYPTTNNRFVSEYLNGSYTYKERYSLYGSARRDASNIFGQSTNDTWNPLWSSGISWDASKESFYHFNLVPNLKIRATYGYSGNVDVTKTPLAVARGGFTNSITNYAVYRIDNLNNPSLRWEKSRQINMGIDFSSRNQIVSGNIDYYRKKASDLYGLSPFDYTAWGQSNTIIKNVASMKGNGLETVLRTKNIDRAVKWNSTLLFNYNTDKVTDYNTADAKNANSLVHAGNSIFPVVGYPLYSIAAYKWGGLDANGDPQGYLGKTKSTDYVSIETMAAKAGLDSGNVVYIGRSSPPVFGSLMNEFVWKGLSISFNISYSFGYYFRKTPFLSNQLINSGVANYDYYKRWQKSGDELHTNVPALVYTSYPQFDTRDGFYTFSEVNVLRADNIRLQYINAGYTFDNIAWKLPFEELKIYCNTANLGILWRANKAHLDPDYPNSLQVPRSITIGLRARF